MTTTEPEAVDRAEQRARWQQRIVAKQAAIRRAQAEIDRLLEERGELLLGIQEDDPSVTFTHLAEWAGCTLPTVSTAVKRAKARRDA